MTCTPDCVSPSRTQAHCSVCHLTWSGVSAFDRHFRDGRCLTPAEMGYTADRRGVYRAPITDAKRAQIAALRRRDADADSARPGEPQTAEPGPVVGGDAKGGSDAAQAISGGSR